MSDEPDVAAVPEVVARAQDAPVVEAKPAPAAPGAAPGAAAAAPAAGVHDGAHRKTPCVLVIGMAGSGKTTLMQRLCAHLHRKERPAYVVNLDPAVHKLSFDANVDIRDTVNYKEVMKQYGLGPNGGIVTSLNLFATRFDQLLGLLEERGPQHDYMLFDTPGQIEVFTWCAVVPPPSLAFFFFFFLPPPGGPRRGALGRPARP